MSEIRHQFLNSQKRIFWQPTSVGRVFKHHWERRLTVCAIRKKLGTTITSLKLTPNNLKSSGWKMEFPSEETYICFRALIAHFLWIIHFSGAVFRQNPDVSIQFDCVVSTLKDPKLLPTFLPQHDWLWHWLELLNMSNLCFPLLI